MKSFKIHHLNISYETVIKNGEHGNAKIWYQNGELSYERQGCLWSEQQQTFIQNGFTKTWHENGQLKSEYNWY